MALEPVEVAAHWKPEGRFEPTQFVWNGHVFRVESTGRDWEDDEGYHVLCMAAGSRVFELVFRLGPAGWKVKPPQNTSQAA